MSYFDTDLHVLLDRMKVLPSMVILPLSHPIRQIQSVFPYHDISPILATLIDDFADSGDAVQRMKSTVLYYSEAIAENGLGYLTGEEPSADKRVRLVKSFDYGIILEQSALDILDAINRYGIRVGARFLSYRFHSINANGSVILEKYSNLEELCDGVYGR